MYYYPKVIKNKRFDVLFAPESRFHVRLLRRVTRDQDLMGVKQHGQESRSENLGKAVGVPVMLPPTKPQSQRGKEKRSPATSIHGGE